MTRAPQLLLVALAAVVTLSGCTSGSNTATPSATVRAAPSASASSTPVPTAPAPTGSPSTAAETRYVSNVQQLSSTLATVDPAILLALGHDVCRSFKAGRSVEQIAEAFGEGGQIAGFSGAEAAVVIGVAVPTLCPQYRSLLAG